MLHQKLTPKAIALAAGLMLLLIVIGGLVAWDVQQQRNQREEARMSLLRDREMGIPTTSLEENVSEEQRDSDRTHALEAGMTAQRMSSAAETH